MSDVNMEQMPDLGRFVDYVWSLKAERDQLRAELAEYQADPSYVTACETIRKLRAKLEAIRGQPSPALIEAVRELIGAANSVNRSRMHEVRGHDDDQPRYWQRKEWVDWLVENGEKAQQALDALPPQQPDTWPALDKPAKVGAVLFNPGLSARLVVESAQRQHEYSQQPEVEAARLKRFQSAMREFHGEQPDAVSVPGVHEFAVEILRGALEGGNFDGGDIQEMGVRHGLLFPEHRTERCGEHCECAEYGFPVECFRIARALLSTKSAEEGRPCDK